MSHLFGFRDFMPNRKSILEHDLKSKERCVMPSRLASPRLASPHLASDYLNIFIKPAGLERVNPPLLFVLLLSLCAVTLP